MVPDLALDMVLYLVLDLFPGDGALQNDAVCNTDFNRSSDSE
jgi:hypothetical protein